jgi:hypothetical protein
MTWFPIDDAFSDHPKVKRIPRRQRISAVGLWTLAGTWCSKHLTDGHFPGYMVDDLGATAKDAAALVVVRLWHGQDHDCPSCPQPTEPDGWVFHQWTDWQDSRDKVLAKREAARERMRKNRNKADGSPDVRANSEGTSGEVREPSPLLSSPLPSISSKPRLQLVCRLTSPDPRNPTTTDADLARWQEIAGPHSDLEIEAEAWLDENRTGEKLRNPNTAWLGWLKRAKERNTPTPPTPPTFVPSQPDCPRHAGEPAGTCRRCSQEATPPPPNLRAIRDQREAS